MRIAVIIPFITYIALPLGRRAERAVSAKMKDMSQALGSDEAPLIASRLVSILRRLTAV